MILYSYNINMDTSIFNIVANSAKPVVHLYGSQYMHESIIKLIEKTSKGKSRKDLKFVSHEFEDLVDVQQYDESARYDGLMRKSWFHKVHNDMPSTVILIYDWSQEQDSIDWYLREDDIKVSINKIKQNSKEAKIMLVVFFSEAEANASPNNRVENKITSLKRNTELEPKGIFMIFNNLEGFASIISKFEKTLYDYSISYYKEMKNFTKMKQKKLTRDDTLNIRYNFKNGYFTEIIKDFNKAIKFYQESYDLLKNLKENGTTRYSNSELRDVADLIALKLLFCHLKHYNVDPAIKLFKLHYNLFSRQILKIKDKVKFIEINWRLNWMKTIGLMLQMVQMNKVDRFKDFWYFPGYYFLNTLHLMQQKVKVFLKFNYIVENKEDVPEDDDQEGKNEPLHPMFKRWNALWFDPHEFQSQYIITANDFIGKPPVI